MGKYKGFLSFFRSGYGGGIAPSPGVNAQPVLGRQVRLPLDVSEWGRYT